MHILRIETPSPQYDLDRKTHALLAYAKKLTQAPNTVADSDIEDPRAAGREEQGIYETTASSRSSTSVVG